MDWPLWIVRAVWAVVSVILTGCALVIVVELRDMLKQQHPIARLKAWAWCQVSRLGLWAIRRQIETAIGRADYVTADTLFRNYCELSTHHADHCERLQHARAGR